MNEGMQGLSEECRKNFSPFERPNKKNDKVKQDKKADTEYTESDE